MWVRSLQRGRTEVLVVHFFGGRESERSFEAQVDVSFLKETARMIMQHRRMLLTGVLMMAFGVIGCDSVKAPRSAQFDQLQEYPKVTALEGLADWVVVSDVMLDPGPPMGVIVPARAKTDGQELDVQYRFFFLDSDDRPLERDPDWRYMRMPSRTRVFMEANALDRDAVDWRLEIRPAR